MLSRVRLAQQLAQVSMDDLTQLDSSVLREAEQHPDASPEERREKKAAVRQAKQILKMVDMIHRNFPAGIIIPDEARLQQAIDMPSKTAAENRARTKAIKAAEKELDLYHKTLKIYLNAKELVREYEISQTILPDMEKRYQEIVNRSAETVQV